MNGRLKLTVGFDTLFDNGKQDLYLTGRIYVPESEYRDLSLFLHGEYRLLATLTLHAGVRKEKADLNIDSYRTLAGVTSIHTVGQSVANMREPRLILTKSVEVAGAITAACGILMRACFAPIRISARVWCRSTAPS